MHMRISPPWSRAGTAPRRARPTPGQQSRDSPEASPKSASDAPVRAGGAVIDLAEGRVAAPDGTVTELRRQSADVLRVLAAHAGRTVSKAEILNAVWGFDFDPGTKVLEVYVGYLRRKLGQDGEGPIETVRNVGYRLRAPRG